MTHALRCLTYCRVSSPGQREARTIESQLRELPQYVTAQGWQSVEVISDDVLSGTRLDRPGLQRVLKLARDGAVDVLLVADTSRITRSDRDAESGLIYDAMRDCGVLVAMPGSIFDLSNPEQALALGQLRLLDAYWLAQHKRRTARGKREALRQGDRRHGGRDPYGFAWVVTHGRHGRYEIIESEAVIVREAYELICTRSLTQTVDELNARGFRTRLGIPWSDRNIRRLLRSPKYKGELHRRAGEYRGVIHVAPIVSPDLWARAQIAMDARRSDPRPGSRKQPRLLSRMIRCECGSAMSISISGRRTRYYHYRCRARQMVSGDRSCSQRAHRAEALEQVVWAAVCKIVLQPERVARAAARKGQPRVNKCAQLESELAKLNRHEARILERSRRGLIGEDALDRELSATQRERARVQHDLAAMVEAAKPRPDAPAIDVLRQRLDSSDLAVRRELLRAVLGASGKIVVGLDGRVVVRSALR